jgi:hypothetical protein
LYSLDMRIFLPFIFLLLLTSTASAQPDSTRDNRSEKHRRVRQDSKLHALRMENFDLQIELKNKDLENLIGSYQEASPLKKNLVKGKVEDILYEIFDLNIKKKEEEASMLNARLNTLENDHAYKNRADEIYQLKEELSEVRGILTFRKENRKRIVEQRMQTILTD